MDQIELAEKTSDASAATASDREAARSALRDLLKHATAVTQVLAERSQQVNTLILNANDLFEVLVERRQAISTLLANTAAVAENLTGLVKDNEAELAPTLDRLNAVTAMLEKNRDNLSKVLPGLKKFEITTSESVASGGYYSAYVPNLAIPQLLQPFLDYAFGTAHKADRAWPDGYGVVGDYVPNGYFKQLAFPFLWKG